jgi:hypothetical protein
MGDHIYPTTAKSAWHAMTSSMRPAPASRPGLFTALCHRKAQEVTLGDSSGLYAILLYRYVFPRRVPRLYRPESLFSAADALLVSPNPGMIRFAINFRRFGWRRCCRPTGRRSCSPSESPATPTATMLTGADDVKSTTLTMSDETNIFHDLY